MGVTGYLLTNDSASPKIRFRNFGHRTRNVDKTKPADPKICRRMIVDDRAYWPVGTPLPLWAGVVVVAGAVC
ncbi:hypothetical protein C9E91_09770 [Rhizobium sp. SEMIA4064]|nr:hypothetical protein C9E91_09770 [Rhizobium sp. SEMIA4064]